MPSTPPNGSAQGKAPAPPPVPSSTSLGFKPGEILKVWDEVAQEREEDRIFLEERRRQRQQQASRPSAGPPQNPPPPDLCSIICAASPDEIRQTLDELDQDREAERIFLEQRRRQRQLEEQAARPSADPPQDLPEQPVENTHPEGHDPCLNRHGDEAKAEARARDARLRKSAWQAQEQAIADAYARGVNAGQAGMVPKDSIRDWVALSVFALIMLAWYLGFSYSSLYELRTAYLYHPSTDQVFRLELAPSLKRYARWRPFIPFAEILDGQPDKGEPLGKLSELSNYLQRANPLDKEKHLAWLDERTQQRLATLDSETWVSWEIAYFSRPDLDPGSLVPDGLRWLWEAHAKKTGGFGAVDAVVTRYTLSLNPGTTDQRGPLEVLDGALLITYSAAYDLANRLDPYRYVWSD